MADLYDGPLDLQELARIPTDRDVRAQLRARINSSRVCWHPEARAVVLALLDHIDPSTEPGLSQEAKDAYAKWQAYYRPEPTVGRLPMVRSPQEGAGDAG